MDIILVNPAAPRADHITEHLGIASLKAFVAARGMEADTLDMSIEGLSVEETVSHILNIEPRMVGVSLLDDSKKNGFAIIRQLKERGYRGKIVVGGYFPTFASKEILRDFPQVDYVVRGEGEITLLELMESVLRSGGNGLEDIKGLSYRRGKEILENPSRPLIEDLDILPPLDRKYADKILDAKQHLRIYGTRGCWGSCSFCDIIGMYGTSKGKRWRRRSAEKLVDEIADLKQKYNTNYFIFNDDQFLIRGKHAYEIVDEFATELERRKLNIQFELMCRADTVQPKVMRRLKEVGLKRIFLGLESFDEKQLKRFNKKITVRQNIKALAILHNMKIDVIASVILADAYTTLWDLLKQFAALYIIRARYFNSGFSKISVNKKLDVYRGSAVYHEYKSKGILTHDDYFTGCDYKLKFWTSLRLNMLTLEEEITRLLLRPTDVYAEVRHRLRLHMTTLKNKLAWNG